MQLKPLCSTTHKDGLNLHLWHQVLNLMGYFMKHVNELIANTRCKTFHHSKHVSPSFGLRRNGLRHGLRVKVRTCCRTLRNGRNCPWTYLHHGFQENLQVHRTFLTETSFHLRDQGRLEGKLQVVVHQGQLDVVV